MGVAQLSARRFISITDQHTLRQDQRRRLQIRNWSSDSLNNLPKAAQIAYFKSKFILFSPRLLLFSYLGVIIVDNYFSGL